MAYIKHINSLKDHDDLLEAKKDSLIVFDFHAQWCGPCHQIAPTFEQLSQRFRQATFAKVDVDKVQSVAQKYNVSAMPTFVFVKNKAAIATVRGADPGGLERSVVMHAGNASGSSSSEQGGDVSLQEFIDPSQVNCLNESPQHGVKAMIKKEPANSYLASDADEQLLINITFNQIVRVRSLMFKTSEVEKGPKTIKLMTNKPHLGFDDFEDERPISQTIDLTEDDVKEGKKIGLRFVRFQSVTTLSIFVESNHGGGDETRIDAIDIFGTPVQTTKDLSGLQKQEE